VADGVPDFAGPLAGMLAGLDWAATHPDLSHVVSVATDAPFLPTDLVSRLVAALREADADLACAASGGRVHPVFGLWPVRLREDLRGALLRDCIRKVDLWTARHKLVTVSFADRPVDPFFNANRPADLDAAATLLAAIETP
jgi:molybdopterin-guanine dinucleotide biosynthesis protein A